MIKNSKLKKRENGVAMLAVLGGIVALIVVVGIWFVSVNNTLISKEEGVKSAWSQVENVYQRRVDLIPNLVNTVKGYASHERQTLENVIQARNQAIATKPSQAGANPEDVKKFQQAQDGLGSALSRLMVVVERYPDLKANENFRDLQVQLEGTENRITVERQRFNTVAQDYNTYIRSFPQAFVASMKGMQPRPYFEAAAGSNVAPKVEF